MRWLKKPIINRLICIIKITSSNMVKWVLPPLKFESSLNGPSGRTLNRTMESWFIKNIVSCKTRNSRQDFKYGRDLRHVISFPIGLALVRTSQHKSEGKIINEGRHPRHVVAPTTHWVYFIMTINILDSISMFTNRIRQHVSILIYKFKCG